MLAPRGRAQSSETACQDLIFKAWVDPVYGVDGSLSINYPVPGGSWCTGPVFGTNSTALQQLNDSTQPFKTLQRAIDTIHYSLIASYCASQGDWQGIVFALPGVYGETAVGGQGEVFPIHMLDRVHVKGLNARACVIRGSNESVATPTIPTVWPLKSAGSAQGCLAGKPERVVLVDYSTSGQFLNRPGAGADLPWGLARGDTAEMLDGFTLQGGDVQVYFGPLIPYRWPLSGRVTNCLFDMRHDGSLPALPTTVRGPYMGILMAKEQESLFGACPGQTGETGYFDQKVLIANNTFILAECRQGPEWFNYARPESVAIIDVTSPASLWFDTDVSNRGVGNPVIANNLFRTGPHVGGASMPFAMLGIDRSDTNTVSVSGQVQTMGPTNVFASSRVGSTNGFFASVPVTSISWGSASGKPWHQVFDCKTPACVTSIPVCSAQCTAAPLPIPVIELYDGTVSGTVDPGFVGEWLTTQIVAAPNAIYNDWRLMPGSPLEDLGLAVTGASNGTVFSPPSCDELQSFRFDHEGWGNPRVVGGYPDIGFDERHGLIVAGSWGNDTISHNSPPAGIQPNAEQGRLRRFFIMPSTVTNYTSLYGTVVAPAAPVPSAWSYPPPGGLNPPIVDLLATQPDFKTQYVSFNGACPTPTPWPTGGAVVPTPVPWAAPAHPLLAFGSYSFVNSIDNAGGPDLDGGAPVAPCNQPNSPRYFCVQAIQHTVQTRPLSTKFWYSNLQFEYR